MKMLPVCAVLMSALLVVSLASELIGQETGIQ